MRKMLAGLMLIAIIVSIAGCSASPGLGGDYYGGAIMGCVAGGLEGEPFGSLAAPMGGTEGSDQSQNIQFDAGTLTAGEWKDAENLDFWVELLNRNDWYQLMENRKLYSNKVVTAFVHDGQGSPCFRVPVQLCDNSGNVLYEAVTDITGHANLLYDLHNKGEEAATVRVNGREYEIKEGSADITAEEANISVTMLDLMLMVDTTGSMSDELAYLQKELEDVISRIADAGEALSIHVSVNFYRDDGDEYVIRDFEFTSDVAEAVSVLNDQDANGGGDYPEAVHLALDNIVKEHQWREEAVKLCFFVLDAPPHTEREIQGIDGQMLEAVMLAAKKGIRIIPVASSGVDTEMEFLLRSWALMTGGTYTFLTDHSGIGNDHLEPTIGQFTVEALNECLIRVISEHCGLEYTAPEQQSK